MPHKLILGIDFDATCVDHRFPGIGKEVPHAVRVMKRLVSDGNKLILFTMRSDGERGNYLTQAVEWFKTQGIELWGIQRNPKQDSWTTSPKAYAQIYIDDAALGCPLITIDGFDRPCVDWLAVEAILYEPRRAMEPLAIVDTRKRLVCSECGHEMYYVLIGPKCKRAIQCHNSACSACPENVEEEHFVAVYPAFEGDEPEETAEERIRSAG